MPNRADKNALSLCAVQDDIRSAPNHQFSNPSLSPNPAQVRMTSKSLDHGDDAHRQPFRRLWLVPSHMGANLPQASSCQS